MSPLESASIKQIRLGLERRGALVVNNHGTAYSGRGVPDLTGVLEGGRAFAIEVKKRDGGETTKVQRASLWKWGKRGALALEARSFVEDVEPFLDR